MPKDTLSIIGLILILVYLFLSIYIYKIEKHHTYRHRATTLKLINLVVIIACAICNGYLTIHEPSDGVLPLFNFVLDITFIAFSVKGV